MQSKRNELDFLLEKIESAILQYKQLRAEALLAPSIEGQIALRHFNYLISITKHRLGFLGDVWERRRAEPISPEPVLVVSNRPIAHLMYTGEDAIYLPHNRHNEVMLACEEAFHRQVDLDCR